MDKKKINNQIFNNPVSYVLQYYLHEYFKLNFISRNLVSIIYNDLWGILVIKKRHKICNLLLSKDQIGN